MALFQDFKKATEAEAPKLLAASIAENEAKAHARALRNKTAMDAGTMYNVGMGDNSPIYDYLSGGGADASTNMLGGDVLGASSGSMPAGSGVLDAGAGVTADIGTSSGANTLLSEALAGAGGSGGAAGGEALAAEALGSGALSMGAAAPAAVAPTATAAAPAAAAAAPIAPLAAALAAGYYADKELLDGKVLDLNKDIWGGAVGKGWLWS